MENMYNNRENIHIKSNAELKKRLRANDSLGKNRKKMQDALRKKNIESNNDNEDIQLQNNKPQLTDVNTPYIGEENMIKIRSTSFTAPKYHLVRTPNSRRDIRRKNILINNNINRTFYIPSDRLNDRYDSDISNNLSNNVSTILLGKNYRNKSRQHYRRNFTEYNMNNNIGKEYLYNRNNIITNRATRDNIKMKEIITLNNILNKQNNQFQLNERELKNKINDLTKNNKKLSSDNMYLKNENKKLLMNLSNIKNELDNIKNMSLSKLDSKDNTINELSNEINELERLLSEKEQIINNLKGNNEKNNNIINQVNYLKNMNQKLTIEKQKNEQMLNKKLQIGNQNIINLTQENKQCTNIINNLKKEIEKYKNNYQMQIQNQRANMENNPNIINQYENKINELQEQINILVNENSKLDELNKKQDKEIFGLIGEKNELTAHMNELNNLLKKSYNSQEKKINNSFRNNMSKNIDNQEILKNNQLQKEIDFLRNKISELENEKEINNNNNYNEIKYQEMQKQIFSLKNEKDELQNKLMNYINSEMNNNKKINKILQEKNVLIIENEKLKNEIKELDNENHKNMLQLTKVSEFQKEYEIIKKENETNFEELKIKNEENEKLSNIILEKERENEQLKLQLANKMENMDEDYDNDILNVGRNNELQEKNNTIEKLERQINSMKNTNEKITMENLELKEKIQLFTSSKEEGFSNVLDNLKEELKDKNMQLQKLIEENKNLKNNRYKSNSNIHNINNEINDEDEKEIDLNNRDKNENNPFNNRITINSQGLTDADKIKLYKDRIKELQLVNESDIIQIKTLKDDIKAMKAKIRNLETFGGQIKDMNEFIYLLNQVLINYKPKKQEQKDALNKIVNALNNFQGIN